VYGTRLVIVTLAVNVPVSFHVPLTAAVVVKCGLTFGKVVIVAKPEKRRVFGFQPL